MPFQRLIITRMSPVMLQQQNDIILARCTRTRGSKKRDFAVVCGLDGSFRIVRPRIYLSFIVHGRVCQVAFVELFTRTNLDGSPLPDASPVEVPRLRLSHRMEVIPLTSFVSAAHLIPDFFSARPDLPLAKDPKTPKEKRDGKGGDQVSLAAAVPTELVIQSVLQHAQDLNDKETIADIEHELVGGDQSDDDDPVQQVPNSHMRARPSTGKPKRSQGKLASPPPLYHTRTSLLSSGF